MKKERAAVTAAPPTIQTLNTSGAVNPDPLMRREEVAAYLNTCTRTVERGVRAGWLPAIKLGPGRNAPLRFRRSAIDAALSRGLGR